MKRIDTQDFKGEVLSLKELKELIEDLPFSGHDFVVFYDDDKDDYVQTILENPELDEESAYLIEARVYRQGGDFTHYRTIVAEAEDVFIPFEAFYNDVPFSFETWEDVTEEFAD